MKYNISKDFVIDVPPIDYQPDPNGLGHSFYKMLKKHSNKIAQVDGETGKYETFGKLLEDSINTALELKKMGFKKGDLLGICSYNQLDCVKPFIAAMFLGLKLCTFDPTLSLSNTIDLMKQVTPKILFVSDNATELMTNAAKSCNVQPTFVIFGKKQAQMKPFSEFISHKHEGFETFFPEKLSNKDVAVILFSSGTTGTPKGICLEHYGIEYEAYLMNRHLFIKEEEKTAIGYGQKEIILSSPVMSFASLYWVSTVLFLSGSIIDGYTRIIVKSFNTDWAWDYLQRYKVITCFMASYQLLDAIAAMPKNADVSHITSILVGGSSISEDQILKARKAFPNSLIIQGCGQTEVSGCYSVFKSSDKEDVRLLMEKPSSCGRPIPGFTYRFVDPETEENLGPNKPGELRVKSLTLLNCYYNRDTSETYDSKGFLRTGDILYYDEDFCFYHVDRIKEMLKYKSWHVAPATLEAILSKHPAVQQSVVVGLPHPHDGDHPLAFVILDKKYKNTSAKELLDYVNKQVDDRHQLRGGLYFLDSLPLTPTGKIKRTELRDKAVALRNNC